MQLKELAAKPKLNKVTLDTDNIVSLYGEPLEFYMWDRQDVPTFLKIVQMKEDKLAIFNLLKDVVLDDQGNPVLEDGEMLPMEVMVAVIEGVVKNLGNSQPQTIAS
jgi:hypothetical protein